MQSPWGSLLLDGSKTIETRTYNLPKKLLGKKIHILESSAGIDGRSSLGNILTLDCESKQLPVSFIGWVVFGRVINYRYRVKFEADEEKHLVGKGSVYGWNDDKQSVIYGWQVEKKGKYEKDHPYPTPHCLVRRMRSLFEFCDMKTSTQNIQSNAKRKVAKATKVVNSGRKKKRY